MTIGAAKRQLKFRVHSPLSQTRGWFTIRLFLFALAAAVSSCTTKTSWYPEAPTRPELPPPLSFNAEAGRGGQLFVTLRSATGEDWLFMLDTGSHITILDKSLEPKLGKGLGTTKMHYGWLGPAVVGEYDAPPLYIGNTRLIAGKKVWTDDLSKMIPQGSNVKGLLGTDCLRHYCFQIDFSNKTLTFLNPDAAGDNLGTAFPLHISSANITIKAKLMEAEDAEVGVDTAEYTDGSLGRKLFNRTLDKQRDVVIRQTRDAQGVKRREARFHEGAVGADVYPDLILRECPSGENFVGLRFLSRHVVTFNFPKRTVYLKQVSKGPLEASQSQRSRAARP